MLDVKKKNDVNIIDNNPQTNDSNEQSKIEWDEISPNGLDEEKLLEEIAALLQELTNEIRL